MGKNLGALEPVSIREIWKTEDGEFTPWLSEPDNLSLLADELGIALSPEERGTRVGAFEADLLASDGQGNVVVIENQFGHTDHDHLGKLLTYYRNLEAKVGIWITGEVRPEHERVIEWLNEITPDDVGFYLVRIEAFRIGDSPPAPKFTVVVEPSQEAKDYGKQRKDISDLQNLRLEFWTQLLERARERSVTTHESAGPIKSYSLWARVGRNPIFLAYTAWMWECTLVELVLDTPDTDFNKKLFDELHGKKEEIENAFGGKLEWSRLDGERRSKIQFFIEKGGLKDGKERWGDIQEDMIDAMDRFARAVTPYVNAFEKSSE